jgi:DNA-binding beta-propeller fold protein YncE
MPIHQPRSPFKAVSFLCLVALLQLGSARGEKVVVVAGGGSSVSGAPATQCRLHEPFGVAFDRLDNLIVIEMEKGQRVLKVDSHGLLNIVAGNGQKGEAGDGGPAAHATFNGMHNLAIPPNGDIYLADTWNNRVRKIDGWSGTISTVAGTGKKGFSGDSGPASSAEFGSVINVALDPKGKNLYVADIENRRVRRIDLASGVVTTVAGNGTKGTPADGADAKSAPLVDPRAVAITTKGEIYILERSGHALRFVDAKGKIRTVAGTGQPGFSGDGGKAREATLREPKHLCLDRDGNVIIADTDNHVIRKFLPREGRIVRVAGTGTKGSAGIGGPPLQVELSQPHGVAVDRWGTLYIVDSYNDRVLKIER